MYFKLRATKVIGAAVLMTAAILISPSVPAAAAAPATIENTGLGAAAAKAAKKPLRAERRTDIDAVACGTSIDQPGGDTTVVTHYNCSDTTLRLALTVSASDGTGTLTSACQEFLPGEAWYWELSPTLSARRPTFIYSVTGCA